MGVKISVSAEAAVATQSLPDGKTGTAYSFTLEGTSPGTWSVSSGNLPDGLTLDSDTGEISGTPTKGRCTIYAYAQNGAYAKVKVTVK